MNATPPEASSEYSKGSEAPKRGSGRSSSDASGRPATGSAKAPSKPPANESAASPKSPAKPRRTTAKASTSAKGSTDARSKAPARASKAPAKPGAKAPAKAAAKRTTKAPAKAPSPPRRSGTRSAASAAAQPAPPAPAARGWAFAATVGCALLGALLLLIAEFTTLFQIHASNVAGPIKSVSTGSNDSYALIPIALAVAVLAVGFWRTGSRSSLLALGVLGIVVLLIALLGDLPDAHASGLIGSSNSHYVDASSTPSAGLYMETLGAVLLLIACGCGFLLIGLPAARSSAGAPKPRTPRAGSNEVTNRDSPRD